MQPFSGKSPPEVRAAHAKTVKQEQACSVVGKSRVIVSSEEHDTKRRQGRIQEVGLIATVNSS